MQLSGDYMKKTKKSNTNVLWITKTALMSAAAIVLSVLESALPDLPVVIPGAKLGLANIATMFAADYIGFSSSIAVSLLKSIFVFVTRGFTAFVMSLFAGIMSTLLMWRMLKAKSHPFGYIGIGVAGAAIHNFTQIITSYFIIGSTVFAYLPVLLIISVITGSITGFTIGIIMPAIKKVNFEKLQI